MRSSRMWWIGWLASVGAELGEGCSSGLGGVDDEPVAAGDSEVVGDAGGDGDLEGSVLIADLSCG